MGSLKKCLTEVLPVNTHSICFLWRRNFCGDLKKIIYLGTLLIISCVKYNAFENMVLIIILV